MTRDTGPLAYETSLAKITSSIVVSNSMHIQYINQFYVSTLYHIRHNIYLDDRILASAALSVRPLAVSTTLGFVMTQQRAHRPHGSIHLEDDTAAMPSITPVRPPYHDFGGRGTTLELSGVCVTVVVVLCSPFKADKTIPSPSSTHPNLLEIHKPPLVLIYHELVGIY